MTKTTEDKRLKEVKKVIEEWDTYPRETQIALESAISMARILTMIRDNEKAGQEAKMRKLFKKKDLGNDSFDLLGWVMNRFPNLPLYISLIALAISIVMALAKK